MKEFLKYNFKYILIFVGVVFVYFLLMDLMTPSNGMSKEDLKKIEQIDKDINLLIESQKKLDESINEYKKEIVFYHNNLINLRLLEPVIYNLLQK